MPQKSTIFDIAVIRIVLGVVLFLIQKGDPKLVFLKDGTKKIILYTKFVSKSKFSPSKFKNYHNGSLVEGQSFESRCRRQ